MFTDGSKAPEARGTLGIGQQIYTPEAIHIATPDPNDRPYAGWLYLSAGGVAYDDTNLTAVELQVGLVGPSAHGGRHPERLSQADQGGRGAGLAPAAAR